ncbi:MAG: hypothetical protein K2X27_11250 [Candidatus Obscuribacterales bacterium]|nr:hypothetical protein [Candidatus Obscuribacterales bacterium]
MRINEQMPFYKYALINAWFKAKEILAENHNCIKTGLSQLLAEEFAGKKQSWLKDVDAEYRNKAREIYLANLWMFLGWDNGTTLEKAEEVASWRIGIELSELPVVADEIKVLMAGDKKERKKNVRRLLRIITDDQESLLAACVLGLHFQGDPAKYRMIDDYRPLLELKEAMGLERYDKAFEMLVEEKFIEEKRQGIFLTQLCWDVCDPAFTGERSKGG